jgi:2-polyprenyl-3-methyl-5-hydroxy-6-metoxy-1,4-benzoquinol methylase
MMEVVKHGDLGTRGRAEIVKLLSSHSDWAAPILDIGCGAGFLCYELSQKGLTSVGLDSDRKMIQLGVGEVEQVSFVLGDAQYIPFRDCSFSAITCLDVIEHVKNDKRFMKEVARAIKEGGSCVLTTPLRKAEKTAWSSLLWFRVENRLVQLQAKVGHARPGYREAEIDRLLEETGLKPIEHILYGGRLAILLWVLNLLVLSAITGVLGLDKNSLSRAEKVMRTPAWRIYTTFFDFSYKLATYESLGRKKLKLYIAVLAKKCSEKKG